MLTSIELQVISAIIDNKDSKVTEELLKYDESYFGNYKDQAQFIQNHFEKYKTVPDRFTFQAEFPDTTLVDVGEPLEYLQTNIIKNKQRLILIDTVKKLQKLSSEDVSEAWEFINSQCDKVDALSETEGIDIVETAQERAEKILKYNKQERVPTGFKEIDELMYGGLSTVEELLVLIARTNSGKSWICIKMMESAQAHGFPVLYYSPEMDATYVGTRFDTWRKHFKNSDLYRGSYSDEYKQYLEELQKETTPAIVIEDSDMPDGKTTAKALERIIKKHGIKLLIIDGLSYMSDTDRADSDVIKYKNICNKLFNISKKYSCAVVVAMQANRETRNNADDHGDGFPSIYNAEGSDHPARIATQVFTMRQVFNEHTLEIRLEKSRTANNQKPVISYVWDINTGNTESIREGDNSDISSYANLDEDDTPIESSTVEF
jgi:replicative DNA helicase